MRLVDTDEARNWTKQNDNTLAFPIGRATTITITSLPSGGKRRRGEEEPDRSTETKSNQSPLLFTTPNTSQPKKKGRNSERHVDDSDKTGLRPLLPCFISCSAETRKILVVFRPQGAVWLRSPEADRRLPIPGHRPSNRSPVQPAIS